MSIPLNIIHQLCAVLPQLMKVGRESRDKAIIRCRARGTVASRYKQILACFHVLPHHSSPHGRLATRDIG